MTDVRIYQTNDGGEIDYVNGVVGTDDGLSSAAYLSLFGGNEDDGGSQGDASKQWWGNLVEDDPATKYRSETQYLLRSIPAVPANLRRIEEAVGRDLQWMRDELDATISARVTIPAVNAVRIEINGELGVTPFSIAIVENWGSRT